MKLIKELSESVQHLIVEAQEGGKKSYYIEGVFMQAVVQNRNGRVYPKAILESAVARYVKDYVNENRAMGELGHPENPQINLDRVCHKIEELKWDGDNVIGRAKVMTETPMGAIMKNLIDEGIKIGVSTRGLGSLTEVDGHNEVGDDFMLTAVDTVSDPSAPSAFVEGILEGRDWVWDGSSMHEAKIAQVKKKVERKIFTEADAMREVLMFLRGYN